MRRLINHELPDLRALAKENWWNRDILAMIAEELARRTADDQRAEALYDWVSNQILELCDRERVQERAAKKLRKPAARLTFSLQPTEGPLKYTVEVFVDDEPWGVTFPAERVRFRFGMEKVVMIYRAKQYLEMFVESGGSEPTSDIRFKWFTCSRSWYSRGSSPGPRIILDSDLGAKLRITLNQADAIVNVHAAIAEFVDKDVDDWLATRSHKYSVCSGGLPSLGKRR